MAKYLAYGEVRFPVQGSSELQELVKHFESNVSFDDLQDEINTWLLLLGSQTVVNRPSIRDISFTVFEKSNPMGEMHYFAQVHYILLGDADDAPNL